VSRGDGRTPEGVYHIARPQPEQHVHLSMLWSYPNDQESRRGARARAKDGGDIMITAA